MIGLKNGNMLRAVMMGRSGPSIVAMSRMNGMMMSIVTGICACWTSSSMTGASSLSIERPFSSPPVSGILSGKGAL